jgi:O-methyltransferase involved in polyketide biosynthesis
LIPRIPLRRGSDAISPTAHYTGHVWVRNGLSHPELATREGPLFFHALQPTLLASTALGAPNLERLLLERHRAIDNLLTAAIEEAQITQVVEIACGMSPRGWRFAQRYGDELVYVEADLPDMAARKSRALARMGSLSATHRVAELDALLDDGPLSLAAVTEALDPDRGLALITEGLLTYMDDESTLGIWRRLATVGERFRELRYFSDLSLTGDRNSVPERAFYGLLSAFVRGRVYTHFDDEHDAVEALLAAGFGNARLHPAEVLHIVDAR